MIHPMLRTFATIFALTVAGGLVAGCGTSNKAFPSSDHPSTSATTAAAGHTAGSPASADAAVPVTKARAIAYAHAVNLRSTDVPEMTSGSPEVEKKITRSDIQLSQCTGGVSPDRRIVDIESPSFSNASEGQGEMVRSDTEVMPTAALAARDNAATRSARGHACVARLLPQVLTSAANGRFRYGQIAVSWLPTPMPGVDGSFGLRIVATIIGTSGQGRPADVRFYSDLLGFVSGPAEINLTATGIGEAVPPATEQQLLSVLVSRAKALLDQDAI
jgi:hypothetical protein